jgi:hypothetical protein
MKRDAVSGILLLAGALGGAVVMILHPTGHELVGDGGHRVAQLNSFVHGLALFLTPVVFLGLLGAVRRLAPSDLSIASLVAFGFGAVAVMTAAAASGFVGPSVLTHIVAAEGSKVPDAFFLYTYLWNQAFAKIHVVAYAMGILLWSIAILRTRKMPQALGIVGCIIAVLVLLGVFSGHVTLDVHGFGAIVILEGVWFAWLGIWLLVRRDAAS